MGIENRMEQDSNRNADSGPEMARLQTLEKKYLYWLTRIPGFGAVTIRRIWETAGSFEKAYYIEGMELKKLGILQSGEKCRTYDRWKERFSCMTQEYEQLQEKGIRFITPLDREYPNRLLHIYDYPMGLYVKGGLPDEKRPTAAIIGARNCTDYGRQAAGYMGRELAKAGVQIISGLALGIDGAGHEGAMKGNGRTYAVLGCGVNICYPRSNYHLYDAIPSQGGILSEFGPDEEPLARNFPMRNRIISGLSDVILVMEARKKSGSLITASLGLEQGKEIFALPGRITDALSAGCNELIQSGAGILTCPEDVLDYMGIFHEKKGINREKDEKGLAKIEKMVYSCLDSEPRHLEQIMVQTGLPAGHCMSALLELELEGFAVRTSGQHYMKTIT